MSERPNERRAHPRVQKRIELEGSAEAGAAARMVTSDLSVGGLHCVSTTDFPEMTRLAVRLMLPPKNGGVAEPLDVEAVVVRRREYAATNGDPRFELALFFTQVSNAAKQQLTRFLQG